MSEQLTRPDELTPSRSSAAVRRLLADARRPSRSPPTSPRGSTRCSPTCRAERPGEAPTPRAPGGRPVDRRCAAGAGRRSLVAAAAVALTASGAAQVGRRRRRAARRLRRERAARGAVGQLGGGRATRHRERRRGGAATRPRAPSGGPCRPTAPTAPRCGSTRTPLAPACGVAARRRLRPGAADARPAATPTGQAAPGRPQRRHAGRARRRSGAPAAAPGQRRVTSRRPADARRTLVGSTGSTARGLRLRPGLQRRGEIAAARSGRPRYDRGMPHAPSDRLHRRADPPSHRAGRPSMTSDDHDVRNVIIIGSGPVRLHRRDLRRARQPPPARLRGLGHRRRRPDEHHRGRELPRLPRRHHGPGPDGRDARPGRALRRRAASPTTSSRST